MLLLASARKKLNKNIFCHPLASRKVARPTKKNLVAWRLSVRPGSGGLVVGGHAKARPYSEDSKLILVPVVKSVVPVV